MDLNQVQLIGRLTKEPELKQTQSGSSLVQFSIATSKKWKDANGNPQEKTEFHNMVAWRKLADIIGQYLHKGSQVFIQGSLETQSWDDKQSGQKRYRTQIVVNDLIMLAQPKNLQNQNNNQQSAPVGYTGEETINVEDLGF